ncbi:MAG: glycoside hydrolase family 27 protein [Acidobacteria bacterium]|nr:glycoside hydrolase family 27 protein [Acidobacteriota bacterium]
MRSALRCVLALFVLAPILATPLSAQAKPASKLAATPPMGWNSWNWFAGKVTDKDIRQAADLIASSGMRDAGYTYVNIDDTWEGQRDANGVLHTNDKFPDMKALADYVHSKGLKLGIYSSPGVKTCAGYAGSFGHEQQDADLYASWGIDYVKYDLCSFRDYMNAQAPGDTLKQYQIMQAAYEKMHLAILKTGRPMVYSLCQYGWDQVWQWGPNVGANSWRTTGDINPSFARISTIGREQAGLAKYAAPGHWNDPDMLEVGNGKLTPDENRTHMGMWAMLAAPLLAGNNLGELTPEVTSILTNREVLAINQDPLGKQASRIFAEGQVEIWARPLANGDVALAVFNFGDSENFLRGISLHLAQAGAANGWKARDVWAAKNLGPIQDDYKFTLQKHASLLLRLSH